MTIMVMDGQGGRMGKSVVEQIRKRFPEDEILAIGTNSIATAAMLKAGVLPLSLKKHMSSVQD